jgi:hypothetical protein
MKLEQEQLSWLESAESVFPSWLPEIDFFQMLNSTEQLVPVPVGHSDVRSHL